MDLEEVECHVTAKRLADQVGKHVDRLRFGERSIQRPFQHSSIIHESGSIRTIRRFRNSFLFIPVDDPSVIGTAHGFQQILLFASVIRVVELDSSEIPFSHAAMSHGSASDHGSQVSRDNPESKWHVSVALSEKSSSYMHYARSGWSIQLE